MKDRKSAWNDRGSKHERQGSVTELPSLATLVAADSGLSHRLAAPESGKAYSQDTGENPP
jgi:hypothetical protein